MGHRLTLRNFSQQRYSGRNVAVVIGFDLNRKRNETEFSQQSSLRMDGAKSPRGNSGSLIKL